MRRMTVFVTVVFVALLAAERLHAQPADFRTDSVEVDGNRLHYRIGGDGPPLLLLHGFTDTGVRWNPYLEDLAEHYTTIVPDLPGHGRSGGGPAPYRFDQVAMDMYGFMDELGFDRFRAMGYSGGGIVLIHMATRKPGRIESMAVVAAPHVHSRSRILAFPSFEDNPERMQDYWREVHPGGKAQVERLIESFHGLGGFVEEIDVPPGELAGIEARTLILLGDRDTWVPASLGVEMYEAIPDAALWIIPKEGHFAIWPEWGGSQEAASMFPAVVTEFLGTDPVEG